MNDLRGLVKTALLLRFDKPLMNKFKPKVREWIKKAAFGINRIFY